MIAALNFKSISSFIEKVDFKFYAKQSYDVMNSLLDILKLCSNSESV
jgi:hypothetical protein